MPTSAACSLLVAALCTIGASERLHESQVSVGLDQQAVSAPSKNVLLVIDVQNGYDSSYVENAMWNGQRGLDYLNAKRTVKRDDAYRLSDWYAHKHKISAPDLVDGDVEITYNKGWNLGLKEDAINTVTARVSEELAKKKPDGAPFYDFVVYTQDFLDPDALGTFELNPGQPWNDTEHKAVALVPFSDYLILTAGNREGTEVSQKIQPHPQCNGHSRAQIHDVNGIPSLCFRKQIDDAFDMDKRYVDVDDDGKPRAGAQTLHEMLQAQQLGPEDARLYFTGIVTNRCVQSSLIHACELGYSTTLLKGGTQAATGAEDAKGKEHIKHYHCKISKLSDPEVLDF